MAWTSPTVRATGDLITAAIWNADVVNNLLAIPTTPTTAKTASATLTAAESLGYRVTMTSASATTITINSGVFAANDSVFITNLGTGVCTVTAGTATVSSAGSLAIPQYGSGLLVMTATGSGIYYPSAAGNAVNTVASASSIAVTGDGTYLLTGTTTVATITGGTTGMTITVQASAQASGVPVVLTYGAGANAIKLAGGRSLGIYAQVPADTAAGAGESVTLRYDGTAWVEIARDLRKVLTYNNAEASGTISAATAATANTLATATSITFDGATPMVISFYLYQWATGSTAVSSVFASLYDGATAAQRVAVINNGTTSYQQSAPLFLQVRLTPSAAARAYGIRAWRANSNGEWNTSSGTTSADSGQGFIRIERDI